MAYPFASLSLALSFLGDAFQYFQIIPDILRIRYTITNSFIMKTSNSTQTIFKIVTTIISVVVLIALASYQITSPLKEQNQLTPIVDFAFDTYCPINSKQALEVINQELANQGISPLDFNYQVNKNIFVVNVQSRYSDPTDPNSPVLLYYCGFAKRWWEDSCANARFVCSIPGPMFYFQVKQQATIIWVNSIDFDGLNYTHSSCYNESSSDHDCQATSKPKNWENCTYFLPTDYRYNTKEVFRVSAQQVPISPHIHGLEVRPVFDGNPLSWFTPNNIRGAGFQSLYNENYFNQFYHVQSFNGKKSNWGEDLKQRTKVIKVTNDQAPGLLFYHDHAMKSTLYNVQNGLGGLWVIEDPVIEASLPKGQYEKFIVFSKQGDARTQGVRVSPQPYSNGATIFERSASYRFRILNAAFDNSFNNVVFVAYYTTQQVDGKYIYEQIDPSNTQYDLNSNKRLIPFTVIGTDTTLFHQGIDGVDYLNFGPAERVDLVIRFDTVLPPNINNVYFVCDDMNEGATVIKYQFQIEKVPTTLIEKIMEVLPSKDNLLTSSEQEKPVPQRIKFPKDYNRLNIPYTNLSLVPDSQIAVKRHRPLFSLPRDSRFMIGAHYMFEDGASDLPKIGTFEEFYMINNLWQDHPMHIHLINHQVVKAYSLKQLPQNPQCTLYFLDFFRLSKLDQFKNKNNVELCDYLWSLGDEQVIQLFHDLKSYMFENKLISTENGMVSGLDVMARSNGNPDYLVGDCDLDSTHKYICQQKPEEVLEHERRWKDTSMVHSYHVFVLRVRWTSTLYDPAVKAYPYFSIPEEHLAEFPGFVYHCHILPHEDNEMMRGFNLQYSDFYKYAILPTYKGNSCARGTWEETMKCINDNLGCPITS